MDTNYHYIFSLCVIFLSVYEYYLSVYGHKATNYQFLVFMVGQARLNSSFSFLFISNKLISPLKLLLCLFTTIVSSFLYSLTINF